MLTFFLALLAALPAAAGTFQPPAGCEGYVTVQSRSCKVSNHYRCAGDARGDQWRVDFGVNGAYFRSRIDYETQWAESHESDGTIELLEPGARDPASFSELLATGRDSFDFSTMKSNGLRENVTGYDQLTGETVVIDGVALRRTKYDVRATRDDGSPIWQARGNEYIHPEWRTFLSGAGMVDLGDGYLPQDFSPVEFAFPGEPGFMTTIPLYDCEPMTARAPAIGEVIMPAAHPAATSISSEDAR
ncbi:MAG: hypothetical protein OEM24_07140 [Paracoccaceae bacterium]|nr:hypothetical protein [Paracoccaceae bacterium]